MQNDRQQLIRSLFEEYIEMYASRDDCLTTRFSENFSGYTGGGDFIVKDRDEWIKITRQDFAEVTGRIHIEMQDLSTQDICDDVVIATAFFKIHLPIPDHILSRETARLSLVFRREADEWKIAHSGISIPYHLVKDGEVYPLKGLEERNRELESLAQEQTKALNETQRMAKIGSWHLDLATNQVKWTEELYRMYGADPTQPPPPYTEHMKLFTPESWERLSSALANTKETGMPYELELEMAKKDGANGWMWVRGEAVKDAAGNITALWGGAQDITERKQAVNALVEREDQHRNLIQNLSSGVVVHAADTRIIFHNVKAQTLLGLSGDQLIGKEAVDPAWCFIYEDMTLMPADEYPVSRVIATRSSVQNVVLGVLRPITNDCVWLMVNAYPEFDSGGQIQQVVVTFVNITDRKRAESDLAHEKAVLEAIFKGIPDAIVYANPNREVININPAFSSIFGFDMDDLAGKRTSFFYESFEEYKKQGMLRFNMSVEQQVVPYVARYRRKNGDVFLGETQGTIIKTTNGTRLGYIGVIRDITERKKAEEILRNSHEALRSIQETTHDGFWSFNKQGAFLDVNPAYCKMSGYTREELLRMQISDLEANESSDEIQARLKRIIEKGHDQFQSRHRRKDGSTLYVEVSTTYSDQSQGKIFAFIRDVSERTLHEAQLRYIAYYDTLTNLPNRVLLADRLNLAMAQTRRRGQSLAVVYLDLDDFKPVNDRHGHDVGDKVLVEVAGRMKQTLREGDTLARMGGDEFIAVLLDVPDIKSCEHIIDRLLAAASQPAQVGGFRFEVSASIGITFYPQTEEMDADQLLRQADNAMYQAKQAGKNRYHLFDTDQDQRVRGQHGALTRIRQALTSQEFVLHYQPKVDLVSGEPFSVEALIRWQHPEKGLLPPADFLPYLDGSDLEILVGEWVIDAALKQLETWHAMGMALNISVNVSANHLLHADFFTRLALALKHYPTVLPSSLILEILETAAISDMSQAVNVLTRCRELGVRISLDDFGTGYSSLTYLRTLPVDILKIDQTFVRDMLTDPSDMGIVVSVIQLAKTFNLMLIAEGVETLEHGAMLIQLGCNLMQGYGIARPMSAEKIPEWKTQWGNEVAWQGLKT